MMSQRGRELAPLFAIIITAFAADDVVLFHAQLTHGSRKLTAHKARFVWVNVIFISNARDE